MLSRKFAAGLIALNLVLLVAVASQHLRLMHMQSTEVSDRSAAWPSSPFLRAANARAADILATNPADNPIVRAATRASEAVVAVGGTINRVTYYVDPFFENFFWPHFGRATREQRIQVPFLGSGVLIDNRGHLVTNVHVIQEVETPFVTLSDGRRVAARVLDKDNRVDVALLKADLDPSPFVEMGDSDALYPGEWVLAIGNPYGDAIPDPRPTVTLGVVSALHRNYKATDVEHERIYLDMIQTDAAINPGNSGGPLVNIQGQIVGLNTFIVSRTGGSVGIGFAIPIKRVKAVVNEILKYGRVRNYAMDFEVVDITPQVARQLQIPPGQRGAVVVEIKGSRGPAARAGLDVGDIIIQADQLRVTTANDLYNYFLSLHVGAVIEFTVIRDGKPRTLRYTIEEYRGK